MWVAVVSDCPLQASQLQVEAPDSPTGAVHLPNRTRNPLRAIAQRLRDCMGGPTQRYAQVQDSGTASVSGSTIRH